MMIMMIMMIHARAQRIKRLMLSALVRKAERGHVADVAATEEFFLAGCATPSRNPHRATWPTARASMGAIGVGNARDRKVVENCSPNDSMRWPRERCEPAPHSASASR